ncbi:unnamed protein product [Triticum turgidum subsp. durum]|uniref:Uncharacterized protein n=1 Tax=Triticum turgidum subsp. durum TaxID=4567 RepID=A0A9R1QCG9_TRITD|nr:unnamed protein product [Triticum turgidum subsp. durum]
MPPPSPVRVVSSRTVKPPARPRERIPLASWDVSMINDAINYDGHELPLFAAQVTELADGGVFVGFVCNHALADGTAFWNFLKALAEISRARLAPPGAPQSPASSPRPMFERWSPDGGTAAPVVLPCKDLSELIERPARVPLRGRVLHFSAESMAVLELDDELRAAVSSSRANFVSL